MYIIIVMMTNEQAYNTNRSLPAIHNWNDLDMVTCTAQ